MTGGRRALYALDPWLLPPVVWGGFELQKSFDKRAPPGARLGESWEVSCVAGRESMLQGTTMTLAAAFAEDRGHFLGPGSGDQPFPLLVKLISTSAPLSVQVHPSDDQARRLEQSPRGKLEAWIVVAADAGAEVIAGLRPGSEPSEIFEAAQSGDAARVRSLLASHPVAPGDAVIVPPGCVHAPGAGIVLYEIQQPVDLTYRIFDWGRIGLDGKPRPLQVEKARQVLDPLARPTITRAAGADVPAAVPIRRARLVGTPLFSVERWTVTAAGRTPAADLLLMTCIGGRGTVAAGPDRIALRAGQTCVVPAATPEVSIEGDRLDLLVASRS